MWIIFYDTKRKSLCSIDDQILICGKNLINLKHIEILCKQRIVTKVSALAVIMRDCALNSKQGRAYSHLGRGAVVSSRYRQHSAEHLVPQRHSGPKYQKYQHYNKLDNTVVHWYPQFLSAVVLSFVCIILTLKAQMLSSGNSLNENIFKHSHRHQHLIPCSKLQISLSLLALHRKVREPYRCHIEKQTM